MNPINTPQSIQPLPYNVQTPTLIYIGHDPTISPAEHQTHESFAIDFQSESVRSILSAIEYYRLKWVQQGFFHENLNTNEQFINRALPNQPLFEGFLNQLSKPIKFMWKGPGGLEYEVEYSIKECLDAIGLNSSMVGDGLKAYLLSNSAFMSSLLQELGVLGEESDRAVDEIFATQQKLSPSYIEFCLTVGKDQTNFGEYENRLLSLFSQKLPQIFKEKTKENIPLMDCLRQIFQDDYLLSILPEELVGPFVIKNTLIERTNYRSISDASLMTTIKILQNDNEFSRCENRDINKLPIKLVLSKNMKSMQNLRSDFFVQVYEKNSGPQKLELKTFHLTNYSGCLDLLFQNHEPLVKANLDVSSLVKWLMQSTHGVRCLSLETFRIYQRIALNTDYNHFKTSIYRYFHEDLEGNLERACSLLINLCHFGLMKNNQDLFIQEMTEKLLIFNQIKTKDALLFAISPAKFLKLQPWSYSLLISAIVGNRTSFSIASSLLQVVSFILINSNLDKNKQLPAVFFEKIGHQWMLKWSESNQSIFLPCKLIESLQNLRQLDELGDDCELFCKENLHLSNLKIHDEAGYEFFRNVGIEQGQILFFALTLQQKNFSPALKMIGYKLADIAFMMKPHSLDLNYFRQTLVRLNDPSTLLSPIQHLTDIEAILSCSCLSHLLDQTTGQLPLMRKALENQAWQTLNNYKHIGLGFSWILTFITFYKTEEQTQIILDWKRMHLELADRGFSDLQREQAPILIKTLLHGNQIENAVNVLIFSIRNDLLSYPMQWHYLCQISPYFKKFNLILEKQELSNLSLRHIIKLANSVESPEIPPSIFEMIESCRDKEILENLKIVRSHIEQRRILLNEGKNEIIIQTPSDPLDKMEPNIPPNLEIQKTTQTVIQIDNSQKILNLINDYLPIVSTEIKFDSNVIAKTLIDSLKSENSISKEIRDTLLLSFDSLLLLLKKIPSNDALEWLDFMVINNLIRSEDEFIDFSIFILDNELISLTKNYNDIHIKYTNFIDHRKPKYESVHSDYILSTDKENYDEINSRLLKIENSISLITESKYIIGIQLFNAHPLFWQSITKLALSLGAPEVALTFFQGVKEECEEYYELLETIGDLLSPYKCKNSKIYNEFEVEQNINKFFLIIEKNNSIKGLKEVFTQKFVEYSNGKDITNEEILLYILEAKFNCAGHQNVNNIIDQLLKSRELNTISKAIELTEKKILGNHKCREKIIEPCIESVYFVLLIIKQIDIDSEVVFDYLKPEFYFKLQKIASFEEGIKLYKSILKATANLLKRNYNYYRILFIKSDFISFRNSIISQLTDTTDLLNFSCIEFLLAQSYLSIGRPREVSQGLSILQQVINRMLSKINQFKNLDKFDFPQNFYVDNTNSLATAIGDVKLAQDWDYLLFAESSIFFSKAFSEVVSLSKKIQNKFKLELYKIWTSTLGMGPLFHFPSTVTLFKIGQTSIYSSYQASIESTTQLCYDFLGYVQKQDIPYLIKLDNAWNPNRERIDIHEVFESCLDNAYEYCKILLKHQKIKSYAYLLFTKICTNSIVAEQYLLKKRFPLEDLDIAIYTKSLIYNQNEIAIDKTTKEFISNALNQNNTSDDFIIPKSINVPLMEIKQIGEQGNDELFLSNIRKLKSWIPEKFYFFDQLIARNPVNKINEAPTRSTSLRPLKSAKKPRGKIIKPALENRDIRLFLHFAEIVARSFSLQPNENQYSLYLKTLEELESLADQLTESDKKNYNNVVFELLFNMVFSKPINQEGIEKKMRCGNIFKRLCSKNLIKENSIRYRLLHSAVSLNPNKPSSNLEFIDFSVNSIEKLTNVQNPENIKSCFLLFIELINRVKNSKGSNGSLETLPLDNKKLKDIMDYLMKMLTKRTSSVSNMGPSFFEYFDYLRTSILKLDQAELDSYQIKENNIRKKIFNEIVNKQIYLESGQTDQWETSYSVTKKVVEWFIDNVKQPNYYKNLSMFLKEFAIFNKIIKNPDWIKLTTNHVKTKLALLNDCAIMHLTYLLKSDNYDTDFLKKSQVVTDWSEILKKIDTKPFTEYRKFLQECLKNGWLNQEITRR